MIWRRAEDYGDYLLRTCKIDKNEYDKKHIEAKTILKNSKKVRNDETLNKKIEESAEKQKYSVLMSLYKKEKPEYLKLAMILC